MIGSPASRGAASKEARSLAQTSAVVAVNAEMAATVTMTGRPKRRTTDFFIENRSARANAMPSDC
jgi:hypothetical protein